MGFGGFSVHFWASKSEPRGTGARNPRYFRGVGAGSPHGPLNRMAVIREKKYLSTRRNKKYSHSYPPPHGAR